MKNLLNSTRAMLLPLILGFLLLGCTNEPILEFQEASLKTSVSDKSSARNGTQLHFNAAINGKNSVPVKASKAVGQVIVTISKDESTIHFKVTVANIQNVTASHFHWAPAGVNGGVVVPLFANPNPQPAGPLNGVLAEGDITSANVVGALGGDLAGFIEAIRSGNIYINIHTMANPGGEIRGQL